MEAIKALSEARTAMVGVHNELNEAKLRLGIRTKMGIEWKARRLSRNEDTTSVSLREGQAESPTLGCNSLTGCALLMYL